ncbi:MAG TPA: alpha/beta hydrolase [Casimicrobiaceae bacterium]|nr:alpha/beta hydrolase [Casimicrobiaceae bacterium]
MPTETPARTLELSSLSPHGFHRVSYYEWGDPANDRVVICVHGLSRNGRDFDTLGAALADSHRVIAVDMPGRGLSQWLQDPADYAFPTYLTTLTALVARSGATRVGWVGTSMGALLGMVMAAQRDTPVARLVINDAGPVIEPAALARIRDYVGLAPTFASFAEAEAYIRAVSAPFGALTDAQWDHLTRTSVARNAEGRYAMTYDPGIAVPFRNAAAPPDLWGVWDAIRCPTLLLRGASSDLLSAATAAAMTQRGPKPGLLEFAGVGHAPMLLSQDQYGPVVDFLRAGD